MTPKEIVVKFAHSLDQFKPIAGQPSDSDLKRIREVVTPLLLQIPYDKMGAVHNLISIIRPEAEYIARYGAAFPEPAIIEAYDPSINYDSMAIVRVHTEAAHKAKHTVRTTYETARRDTTQFILAVFADTWVRDLRDTKTLYTEVAPTDLLSHLQAVRTGRRALDLLALHNVMQKYHLEVEGIPEYIPMLEDAQKQAGRTIANETLILFATATMLTIDRFLRTNDNWEDLLESNKTWENWKEAYNKTHTNARIKAQANKGTVKFGAANSAAHQETTQNVDKNQGVYDRGMKSLEGIRVSLT